MALFDSILLVGDRGMLAHALRTTLAAQGHTTVGVDADQCDITRPEQIEATFLRVRPTLVINCAAYTNVDACEVKSDLANAVNGTGVGNLAKACQRHGAAIVHYSTDYVFDGTFRRPLRPNDPVGPSSAYGRSKLLGEQCLQEYAPHRWLIIRTAWLYGPGGPNFPQAMLGAAKAGKSLRVVSDQEGSPTFTFDLASATLALLKTSAKGFFHLTNSGHTNWFDFAKAIFEEFAVTPSSLQAISSADWKKIKPDSADRPRYSVLDIAPFSVITNQPIPHWRDALHRYRLMIST